MWNVWFNSLPIVRLHNDRLGLQGNVSIFKVGAMDPVIPGPPQCCFQHGRTFMGAAILNS